MRYSPMKQIAIAMLSPHGFCTLWFYTTAGQWLSFFHGLSASGRRESFIRWLGSLQNIFREDIAPLCEGLGDCEWGERMRGAHVVLSGGGT